MDVITGGKSYATDTDIMWAIARKQVEMSPYQFHLVKGPRVGIVVREHSVGAAADDCHILVSSRRISMQISMFLLDSALLAQTFVSPQVVTPDKRGAFIALANELNIVDSRMGAFGIDDLDLYYRSVVPYTFLRADYEEARKALLETGVSIFESVSVPIWGIVKAGWDAEKAVAYVRTLYRNGFVVDDDWE